MSADASVSLCLTFVCPYRVCVCVCTWFQTGRCTFAVKCACSVFAAPLDSSISMNCLYVLSGFKVFMYNFLKVHPAPQPQGAEIHCNSSKSFDVEAEGGLYVLPLDDLYTPKSFQLWAPWQCPLPRWSLIKSKVQHGRDQWLTDLSN